MTKDILLSVLTHYDIVLEYELDAVPKMCDFTTIQTERQAKFDQCAAMIPLMREMTDDWDNMETRIRFYRWLTFMQGVLWSEGVFCLEDLRSHNKKGCDNEPFNVVP